MRSPISVEAAKMVTFKMAAQHACVICFVHLQKESGAFEKGGVTAVLTKFEHDPFKFLEFCCFPC